MAYIASLFSAEMYWRIARIITGMLLMPAFVFSQAMETVLQLGHPASITCVDISNTGQYILTGSKDKTIKLWDLRNGKEIRSFAGHASEITSIKFSPDGTRFASSSYDHTIKIWDLHTGETITSLEGHDRGVSSIDYEPGGRMLVSGSIDGKGLIWDVDSGKILKNFKLAPGQYGPDVRYSPDGNFIAVGNDDGVVLILNADRLDTLYRIRELDYSSCGGCYSLSGFSNDLKYLVTAADRGPLVLWNFKTGEKIRILLKKAENYVDAGFTADNAYIYAADEKNIYLWNAPSGELARTITGHSKNINTAISDHTGKYVLSGSDDNTAILWEVATGTKKMEYSGSLSNPPDNGLGLDPDNYWDSYPYQVIKLKKQFILSPSGEYLVKGTEGSKTLLWDWKSGKKIRELRGHTKSVISFDISPDGKYIVTGGGDNKVILWNAETGDSVRAFSGHRYVILDVAFSHDGKMLATAGYDGYAMVWMVESGEPIRKIRLEKDPDKLDSPYSIQFSPNDLYIITGSLGGKLTMREIDSGEEFIQFTGHTEVVTSIIFSRDQNSMVTGSWDHSVRMWDYRTGFLERKFIGHTEPVNEVAISADGNNLLSGSTDRSAILWDIHSGEILKRFEGHKSAVVSVAFSPDRQYVLTGTIDGVIRIWEISTGVELITYYFVGPDDWMARNNSGFFHSTEGVRKYLHFVRGLETYDADQFFESFFLPDIMEKTFRKGRSFEEGFNVIDKLEKSPPPDIEITFPHSGEKIKNENIDVLVKVTNRGGGIDEVKLLHNGKRIANDREGLERTQTKGRSLYQTYNIRLIPGQNTFCASAFSRERIESKPSESTVIFNGKGNPATCYLVSIGINRYQNSKMNLNYARADAETFAGLIGSARGNLFDNVHEITLYDTDATRKKILASLEMIADKADPSDVFFFFYAGHGSMVEDNFYFIPTECVRLYEENSLEQKAISAAEIQEKFKKIQALKQLVIVDACQSGGSAELLAQRGVGNEKAIAQLSRSAGVHVMASAGSEQFATEFESLGHGLFTYVLLEALSGKADGAPQDGRITIFELKSYLDTIVPELSEKFKGQPQYPYTFSRGQDFPLMVH